MPAASVPPPAFDLTDEVRSALERGRAVVALESTIISHGLPRPDNLRVAREVEAVVRSHGAVPATIALAHGRVRIGLDDEALAAIAANANVVKAGVRDIAPVLVGGGYGATTVASTAHLAALAGITVFATGGLGGVHREAAKTFDESADLITLSRVGTTVVCAGVKSILDVPATLERLETLGIGLLGFGTDRFPGFYLADSGLRVEHRVETAVEVAEVMAARAASGTQTSALLVLNPVSAGEQLDPALHDRVLHAALDAAAAQGIRGKDTTPYLLARLHDATQGRSLAVNTRIISANAALAAQIAVAAAAAR